MRGAVLLHRHDFITGGSHAQEAPRLIKRKGIAVRADAQRVVSYVVMSPMGVSTGVGTAGSADSSRRLSYSENPFRTRISPPSGVRTEITSPGNRGMLRMALLL